MSLFAAVLSSVLMAGPGAMRPPQPIGLAGDATWPILPKAALLPPTEGPKYVENAVPIAMRPAYYYTPLRDVDRGYPRAIEFVLSSPKMGQWSILGEDKVSVPQLDARPGNQNQLFIAGPFKTINVPYNADWPIDLGLAISPKSIDIYLNGVHTRQIAVAAPPDFVKIGDRRNGWKGALVGFARYSMQPSAAQWIASNGAAIHYAYSALAPTVQATLRLKLGAYTEVPEPSRIRPYVSALLAQEYSVVSYVNGRLKGVRPGDKIHIFRFGVKEGKKTALKDMKTGDSTTLTIELLDADPELARVYQLDTLDTSLSPTFVEVPKTN